MGDGFLAHEPFLHGRHVSCSYLQLDDGQKYSQQSLLTHMQMLYSISDSSLLKLHLKLHLSCKSHLKDSLLAQMRTCTSSVSAGRTGMGFRGDGRGEELPQGTNRFLISNLCLNSCIEEANSLIDLCPFREWVHTKQYGHKTFLLLCNIRLLRYVQLCRSL